MLCWEREVCVCVCVDMVVGVGAWVCPHTILVGCEAPPRRYTNPPCQAPFRGQTHAQCSASVRYFFFSSLSFYSFFPFFSFFHSRFPSRSSPCPYPNTMVRSLLYANAAPGGWGGCQRGPHCCFCSNRPLLLLSMTFYFFFRPPHRAALRE